MMFNLCFARRLALPLGVVLLSSFAASVLAASVRPNRKARELAVLLGHNGYVMSLCFSRDGKYFLSDSTYETKLWDFTSRKEIMTYKRGAWAGGNRPRAVFSWRESRVFEYDSGDDNLYVWNRKMGGLVRKFQMDDDEATNPFRVMGLVNERLLLIFHEGNKDAGVGPALGLLDVKSGKEERKSLQLRGAELCNFGVLAPDRKRVLIADRRGIAVLVEIKTGKMVGSFEGPRGDIGALAFAPDGRHVAMASEDDIIRVWDTLSNKLLMTLKDPVHSESLAFLSDGKRLLSGGHDGFVRLWNLANGKLICSFRAHDGPVWCLALSPSETLVLSGGFDSTIRIWRLPD